MKSWGKWQTYAKTKSIYIKIIIKFFLGVWVFHRMLIRSCSVPNKPVLFCLNVIYYTQTEQIICLRMCTNCFYIAAVSTLSHLNGKMKDDTFIFYFCLASYCFFPSLDFILPVGVSSLFICIKDVDWTLTSVRKECVTAVKCCFRILNASQSRRKCVFWLKWVPE